MKQIYLTIKSLGRARHLSVLLLAIGSYCEMYAQAQQVEAKVPILPKTIEVSSTSDLVITSQQIRNTNPINLWQVIRFFDPSIVLQNSNELGSDETVMRNVSVRGNKNLATNDIDSRKFPLLIIDGAIVNYRRFSDMDINDVDQVIIRKDPVSLAKYGIRGADCAIEMVTKKPVKGSMKVNYALDAIVEWADLGSYNLMNASEHLALQDREGYYSSHPELLAQRKATVAAGQSTDWMDKLFSTKISHRHRLAVEGGDDNVKYGLTARLSPANHGVTADIENGIMGLGAYIEYRYKSFKISNDMTYDKSSSQRKYFVTTSEYTKLPAYLSATNSVGQFNKEIGSSDDLVLFENPCYEQSLGSFFKTNTHSIFDNVHMSLDLGAGFTANGRFSFSKDMERTDSYISPSSALFKHTPTSDYKGSYGITRSTEETYEGAADLTYMNNVGKSTIGATLQASIFNGVYNMESYAGVGIPSDQMSYISFTKAYNTNMPPYAWRSKDHTLSGSFSAYYSYDDRYLLNATVHADKSSMLAPENNEALFYGVSAAWNIHNEKFAKRLKGLQKLTLSAAIGTSGKADAMSSDYIVSYSSNINNEYIYNYYLIGASINGMTNPNLKWRTQLNRGISIDAKRGSGMVFRFNYYNNESKDLLIMKELNHATGYKYAPDNGGKIRNSGIDYYLSANILSTTEWRLSGFTSGNHNSNKINEIPDFFRELHSTQKDVNSAPLRNGDPVNAIYAYKSTVNGSNETVGDEMIYIGSGDAKLRGNLGLNASYKRWSASVACDFRIGGYVMNKTLYDVQYLHAGYNNDVRATNPNYRFSNNISNKVLDRFVEKLNTFNLSTVQLGYSFPSELISKVYLRNLSVFVTGNNLIHQSSVEMQRGILYPYTRTFTLSLRATF